MSSESDFFVFAGRIYQRKKTKSSLLWKLLENTKVPGLAIVSSLIIFGYIFSSRYLKFVDATESAKKRKRKRKLLINGGSGLVILRSTYFGAIPSKHCPKTIKELEIQTLGLALSNFATHESSFIHSEAELEQFRSIFLKLDTPKERWKFYFEIRSKIPEKRHPLRWNHNRGEDDDIVEIWASLYVPLKIDVADTCAICHAYNSNSQFLSSARRICLREASRRSYFDNDLEKLFWFGLTTPEQDNGSNSLLATDCLRIIELATPIWTDISRSWIDFKLNGSFFSSSIPFSQKRSHKEVVYLIENLLKDGNRLISCGSIDSGEKKIFGHRGARFSRYDVLVDNIEKRVYFNETTFSNPKLRERVVSLLNGHANSCSELIAEENILFSLLSRYYRVWVFSISGSDEFVNSIGTNISEILTETHSNLKLSSEETVGVVFGNLTGVSKAHFSSSDSVVLWFSSFVTDMKRTVLLFAKEGFTLCGCKLSIVLERLVSSPF